ncbi:GNAT family N-acetyltransferase [Janibacter sp. GXQ6167]|uniref:GNAT family N-acetyltransferase n=1 Tax=Janibacter sp. GXQ6167 TaxID=3240791 RepID=UPI00352378E9
MGCSVRSVSHNRFGPAAVKSRSTRSSCTGGPGFFHRPRARAGAETIRAWSRSSTHYLIRRELWGHGLATEIATALFDWHLTNVGNSLLRAIVHVGNDASARVPKKSGLREYGREDYEGIPCRAFLYPSS